MHELLFEKVLKIISLSEEELMLCKTLFIPRKLRKKYFLLQEGDPCRYVAFVERGLLRSYTNDDKGEHIIQFATEGYWISDTAAFLTGENSTYNIEALEDSELLLLDKGNWESLLEKIPKFERYFRILMQNNIIALHKRIASSLADTAEQKYKSLVSICPDIIQRIPQHMIASFLGVTPETLSRIRSKMAQVT